MALFATRLVIKETVVFALQAKVIIIENQSFSLHALAVPLKWAGPGRARPG